MRFSKFFEQLQPALRYPEMADRLAEELQEHMEDSSELLRLGGRSEEVVEELVLESMGTPKQIAHEYNQTMKFQNSTAAILQTLLVSILSIPVFFLLAALIIGVGINTLTGSVEFPGNARIIFSLGVAFIISVLVFFVFYSALFQRLLIAVDSTRRFFEYWVLSLLLPELCIGLTLLSPLWLGGEEDIYLVQILGIRYINVVMKQ